MSIQKMPTMEVFIDFLRFVLDMFDRISRGAGIAEDVEYLADPVTVLADVTINSIRYLSIYVASSQIRHGA